MRALHRIAVITVLANAGAAHAVTARPRVAPAPDELTALPAAGVGKPLRRAAAVRWSSPPVRAWERFAAAAGGSWRAMWDPATGIPSRIWGAGIVVPGAMRSAEIAERAARRALAEHVALLAPGSATADFELVSNHFDGRIRSVGFVQRAGGLRVVGGQISFRFKADRLFVIGSEALPHVAAPARRARGDGDVDVAVDVILPLIGDDAVLGYRVCTPMLVDGGAAGRHIAYTDPDTREVIAVQALDATATGTVLYRVVDRHPGRGRRDEPAQRAAVSLDGAAATTTIAGAVAWPGEAAAALATTAVGALVTVVDRSPGGASATASFSLAPGGTAVWDASAREADDAQVNVFHSVSAAKAFVRAHVDPDLPGLDAPIVATANGEQVCNAFFDGAQLHFGRASSNCQNTGLIQDVVYHEYGHAVHRAAVIPGVGAIDKPMSEGVADFLAASIADDPGVGRGFFYSDAPLRQLDPAGAEATWPRDIDEIHVTGLIYAGAMWDLRTAAIAALGDAEGRRLALAIYRDAMRRATTIPSALIEALATDDDDGDLANGTPHECLIRAAFGRHGLRDATGSIRAPGAVESAVATAAIDIELARLSACPADAIERVTLVWEPPPGGDSPAAGSRDAIATGAHTYRAELPLAEHAAVRYRAIATFADGTTLTLADNLGDPEYQLYRGDTVPLYCTSFDTDPFAEGWSTAASDGGPSPWQWGQPGGGATDPPAAFSGAHVLALGLGGDYPSGRRSRVTLPPIDVGAYTDVRLHYRRWLAVEDSRFDEARILANGAPVWRNETAHLGNASALHHVDREWRFHDVPLPGDGSGALTVEFDIAADGALSLGGWAIDDLCVVANPREVAAPSGGCSAGDPQSSSRWPVSLSLFLAALASLLRGRSWMMPWRSSAPRSSCLPSADSRRRKPSA